METKFMLSPGNSTKYDFSRSMKLSIGSESKCHLRPQAKTAHKLGVCWNDDDLVAWNVDWL